jgi:phosphate transport system substrate-binding protein
MRSSIVRFFSALVVLAAAAAVMTGCSKSSRERVVIKRSTTVLPIIQKAVEAYRKDNPVSISVDGSGSGNGIKAVIDGSCDIASSSREMKGEEIASAQAKGVTPREIAVAYDMIVPVVHPDNPVRNLSLKQLKGIYEGSITNWKEVGGRDEAIVVISRDTSSGTYEVWESMVMKKADVGKKVLLQASSGAVSAAVSTNSKAIGYVGFGYLNKNLAPLTVDGVEGTIENGKSGKYPISRKLYIIVNDQRLSPEAEKFVNFILGEAGQKLVEEAGFIPL